MNISEPLITWYIQYSRDLPWRETKDPYAIWLSEIILQQTRVEQGLGYYLRFINTYPTVGKLAGADIADILKLWQGLGYYSRARNLHLTAKNICVEYGGEFPKTYKELVKLKGVGPYTAAAIASFAFQLPHAVVDGNVSRVVSRLFDLELAVNSSEGAKVVKNLADECLSQEHPDLYNQAIMELGAMVCTATAPDCPSCPLRNYCLAFAKNTQKLRPVKLKKAKARLRYIHYAVLEHDDGLIFRNRQNKDIWQGLNDFVSLEEVETISPPTLAAHVKTLLPHVEITTMPSSAEFACTHQLTHQRIEATFWRFKINGSIPKNSIYLNVAKREAHKLAVPRLVHKYLEKAKWLQ